MISWLMVYSKNMHVNICMINFYLYFWHLNTFYIVYFKTLRL